MDVVFALFLLVVLAVAHWNSRQHATRLAALLALDAVALGLLVVALADRNLFSRLAQEDGPVEWATFWAFLAAGLLALWSAIRGQRSHAARLSAGLLAAFCQYVAPG